jgi:putative ABC transport system substrate-binding protein
VREAESAGRAMGLRIQIFNTGTVRKINAAFATLARGRPDALFVSPNPTSSCGGCRSPLWPHTIAVPTSFSTREPVEAGGLISYGTKIVDAYRQAGLYSGRVLEGAKLGTCPSSSRASSSSSSTHKRHLCSALPCLRRYLPSPTK